jgi:hypothetical protein
MECTKRHRTYSSSKTQGPCQNVDGLFVQCLVPLSYDAFSLIIGLLWPNINRVNSSEWRATIVQSVSALVFITSITLNVLTLYKVEIYDCDPSGPCPVLSSVRLATGLDSCCEACKREEAREHG